MRGVRAPVIAGIGAGAGTTTVATALHGLDGGIAVAPADHVDVLVWRSGGASPGRLEEFVGATPAGARARLVLAVVLDDTAVGRALPAVGRYPFAHVALLPHVAALRDRNLPRSEVATLLARRPEQLGGPLRAYVDALRELAGAVVAGGGLAARTPRGPELWRGLAPVERRVGGVVRLGARWDVRGAPSGPELDDLDDDALEAGQAWRAAG